MEDDEKLTIREVQEREKTKLMIAETRIAELRLEKLENELGKNDEGNSSNPVGRPTKYSPEIIEKSYDYIENYKEKYGDEIPSVVGLAAVINVRKSTIYEWAKDDNKKEFSDTLGAINEKQEQVLWNYGLNGRFNSSITKLALGNHGYSDKTEGKVEHGTGIPVLILPSNGRD